MAEKQTGNREKLMITPTERKEKNEGLKPHEIKKKRMSDSKAI